MKTDLIVIGAGPAGLSAAIKAAAFGAKVTVIDENPKAGGKLLGQLHEEPGTGWWIGKQKAAELSKKASELGVKILQETQVWGIYPNWSVKTDKHGEIGAPYILLATGAAERAIPIPGWTLPGVIAIGAAQVMNNYYRVRPGNKILIIGIDVLALTVARELKMAGADIAGIVLPPPSELSQEKSNPASMISYLSSLSHLAPTPLLRLAGSMVKSEAMNHIGAFLYPKNGVKVWDIPLQLRKAAIEIEGDEQVKSVKIADLTADGKIRNHSAQNVEVDCVCISGGLYPLSELASAVGCEFAYLPELGGHVPLHSPLLETTKIGIFIAGNITGIEGAKVAMAQGELAGTVIASRLKLVKNQDRLIMEAQNNIIEVRGKSDIQFYKDIRLGREKMEQIWSQMSVVNI